MARHIKVLLDQLGLTSYPKTSGATGMQIFMPHRREGPTPTTRCARSWARAAA